MREWKERRNGKEERENKFLAHAYTHLTSMVSSIQLVPDKPEGLRS